MLNRWQFYVLSATSLLLIVLLIGNYALVKSNGNLSRQLAQTRAVVVKASRMEGVLQQVTARLAQASDKEPETGEVLIKSGLNVKPMLREARPEPKTETKGKGTP